MKSQTSLPNALNFGFGKKLPFVMQAEVAECGLACLAMVSGYYGSHSSLSTLRQRFVVSQNGTNLKRLIDIASKMRLTARALRLEPANLSQLALPCILHWKMNHFVVLSKIRNATYEISDPAHGITRVTEKEMSQNFTGVALELVPTAEFSPNKNIQRLRLSDFWTKAVGLKSSLVTVLALSLLLQLFAILAPVYTQTVIDQVIITGDANLLKILATGFSLLLIIQVFTSILRDRVIQFLSQNMALQLSANVFHHLIRLPMDYFYKRHIGDIVSRFGSLRNVRQVLTQGLVVALVDGLMAMITLAAMFIYSATLALTVLAFVLVYIGFRTYLYHPMKQATKESVVAQAAHDTNFIETMRATQTIKLFQQESNRQNQWHNVMVEAVNKNIMLGNWQITYAAIKTLLFGVENIVVVFLAASLVTESKLTLGMFFAFVALKMRFSLSLDSFIEKFIELKILDIHLDRLADIVHSRTDPVVSNASCRNEAVSESDRTGTDENSIGTFTANDLSYAYSEEEGTVFHGLNFQISQGDAVVITGPSGCGKTTLLKCLMGLIEPDSGSVRINGQSIFTSGEYRRNIAAVMQDDQLLSGSLAENISCFAPNVNIERVIHSARIAGIHDEIMRMPMRYETYVGDMGSTLSGGQKQRVFLARALYRKPRILFLDEATSHLDVAKEAEVNSEIQKLAITRIMVAHRPETIRTADKELNLPSLANAMAKSSDLLETR